MEARQFLIQFWDESWKDSNWWPAFSVVVQDLTPQQAVWKPAPQRHSIWQILNHICFWREVQVRRLKGEKVPQDEIDRRNFEEPAQVNDQAWRHALCRFESSQQLIREALGNQKFELDRLKYLLPHDAHHVGQITYLRAFQGLPPHKYE